MVVLLSNNKTTDTRIPALSPTMARRRRSNTSPRARHHTPPTAVQAQMLRLRQTWAANSRAARRHNSTAIVDHHITSCHPHHTPQDSKEPVNTDKAKVTTITIKAASSTARATSTISSKEANPHNSMAVAVRTISTDKVRPEVRTNTEEGRQEDRISSAVGRLVATSTVGDRRPRRWARTRTVSLVILGSKAVHMAAATGLVGGDCRRLNV